MRRKRVQGRIWVLRDPDGTLFDDVDTDMIFHNRYLHITDVEEMGQYALDNLQGWEDFGQKAEGGDIIVVGKNFGSGSSRQQAVDCFKTLGVAALVAESFGAIYERNAVNAGLPIMYAPVVGSDVRNGEEVEVDFAAGVVKRANGEEIRGTAFSETQMAIYRRGGLLAQGGR